MDKLVEANQRALDLQYMLDSAQQEVERLRAAVGVWEKANSDLIAGLKAGAKEVIAKDARIKELETDRRALMSNNVMTDYVERLEAAFLASEIKRLDTPDQNHTWYPGDESYVDFVKRVKREAEHKAREALERIRNGE